jgi:DNA-directed RNA polymerase subunit RPC12/RpoP
MFDVIPGIMAQARRGICPTCGAPMQLAEAGRDARCDFCGGGSQLKFTLRALEPDAEELQKPKLKGATRWIEKQAKFENVTCPGCGAEFEANASHSIQTCKYCGAQSKLETRLLPITTDDVDAPCERTEADVENARRDRIDHPWDLSTEQLCWRVLNERELLPRVNLSGSFQSWGHINHTAAHFLPWLLKHIQTDHDAVACAVADAVGKLLCEGDPTLWPGVIQACRGVVFDVHGKACILHELGLGKGVCVKTLIDAAEFAAAHGARDYACQALWSVNTLIGRNFDEHPVIAQIVLYRLFYVTGPVLGWALYTMRSSYLRGRYPLEFLVRTIDELSIERPQIVEHLLDCLYTSDDDSPAEFERRLGFIRDAQGWGGRAAGFETLYRRASKAKQMDEAIALIDADLDHPQAGKSAEIALYRLICAESDSHPAFDEIVARRGETLSYRVKREYIRRNPETRLLKTSEPYCWQSDPERPFDPEMQKLVDQWDEGIRAAVDNYHELVEAARKVQREADKLEAPLFLREGPATIPLSEAYTAEVKKQDEEEKRQDDQQADMERIQQEYQNAMESLQQKMMANMHDAAAMQKYSAEVQKLVEDFQRKMQSLWGNG